MSLGITGNRGVDNTMLLGLGVAAAGTTGALVGGTRAASAAKAAPAASTLAQGSDALAGARKLGAVKGGIIGGALAALGIGLLVTANASHPYHEWGETHPPSSDYTGGYDPSHGHGSWGPGDFDDYDDFYNSNDSWDDQTSWGNEYDYGLYR